MLSADAVRIAHYKTNLNSENSEPECFSILLMQFEAREVWNFQIESFL